MSTQIVESNGDIFASRCDALVSPVDCTGVQGAGLALEFVRRFPEQTKWYREHAAKGHAEPGRVYHVLPRLSGGKNDAARWVLDRHRHRGGEALVLFATSKAHWSKPSRLSWVTGCCLALVDVVNELEIRSVAIPPLGCGLGQRGISPADAFGWEDVRPLILAAAEKMTCERVVVYEPR